MVSLLHTLVGLSITKVVRVHDYIQLHFGDEIGMSVYNKISLDPAVHLDELVGKMVTSVNERDNSIDIKFLGGPVLRIDMRREAYQGPEAIELNRKGSPPVIWN